MISAGFLNRVRFYSSTTGTGAVTAGSAYSSAFLTPPAAGAVDGKSYTWLITDGNNIEIVDGAWSASGGSFARTNVRLSINGGTAGTSLLSLSGNEVCEIIVAAEDLDWLDFAEQSIASAATADLSTVNQSRVAITGTTTITSLGAGANLVRFVRFAGALLLTYNATSLILPGAANITTAAGDMALFASDPSGNWRCLFYLRASGKSVVLPASADITDSTALGRALIISARAAISDANYSVAAGISVAAYTSITAARAVTLPAASSYAAGQQLLVVDESGSCSATKTITLNRAGSDTINGATSAAISTPYGFIAIESNGSNAWTIVDQSTLSMAQQAASAVAITGGSLAGVSLALARQAVSDANYSVAAGIGVAAYTAITAARAVTLPAASSYAAGQQLLVVDESGSCSATKTITLNRAGSDTINGATSAVINSAYGYLVLESNGSNAWTIVDQGPQVLALNGLSGGVTLAATDGNVVSASGTTVSVGGPGGMVNKFRNSTMDVWQRGTSGTVTTSGAYTADGWIVLPTGATAAWAQASGRLLTKSSLQVTGATSVTDLIIKQRIESLIAAAFCSQTVTVQAQVYNGTGGSITPKLSVNRATGQDNGTYTNVDVNAVSLQSCPASAWTQISYTFSANANSYNGLEVVFDFGNNFGANTKTVQITECDIRVTPGATSGLNSNPPPPELRPVFTELPFCLRYLWVTPNSTQYWINAVSSGNSWAQTQYFPVPMRASPTASNVSFSSTVNIGTMAVNVLSDAAYSSFGPSSGSGQCYGVLNAGVIFSAEL